MREEFLADGRETAISCNKQIPNYLNDLTRFQNFSLYRDRGLIIPNMEREKKMTPQENIWWQCIAQKAMKVTPMCCSEVETLIPCQCPVHLLLTISYLVLLKEP